MRAMKNVGVANSGTSNQVRVITWKKPNKYAGANPNTLAFDVEFYLLCVYTIDEKWPAQLFKFNETGDGKRNRSSVIEVPQQSKKSKVLRADGSEYTGNPTEEPHLLGYQASQAFCKPGDKALFPGVGAGGAAFGAYLAGMNIFGFDRLQDQVDFCNAK
jgi:hypothetical protein